MNQEDFNKLIKFFPLPENSYQKILLNKITNLSSPYIDFINELMKYNGQELAQVIVANTIIVVTENIDEALFFLQGVQSKIEVYDKLINK